MIKNKKFLRRWIVLPLLLVSMLLLSGITTIAQSGGIRIVVVNDFLNVRITPALGAPVIATVPAGTLFEVVTAQSGDHEWVRVEYFGNEGWIHLAPTSILAGNVSSLPVADPRTIPFGGFEAPRSGTIAFASGVAARSTASIRLRAGPSTGYPTLAGIFFREAILVTGRNSSGTWLQVVYEDSLGWVSTQYVELLQAVNVFDLPVGGIIADEPPLSRGDDNALIGVLGLMRDRLDLAQPSLDRVRAMWVDAAITGRAACFDYPSIPSDFNIPVPTLAAYNDILDSLLITFNDAMANLRLAIREFIAVCNLPGTGNPVSDATVEAMLNAVNLADAQFAALRTRLNELIPPTLEAGDQSCLVIFARRAEIVPRILFDTVYLDDIFPDEDTNGYCFTAIEGQTFQFDFLRFPDATLIPFVTISLLDNPTDFEVIRLGNQETDDLSASFTAGQTGDYLLIISDYREARDETIPPEGEYAFVLQDTSFRTFIPDLVFDEDTGRYISNKIAIRG